MVDIINYIGHCAKSTFRGIYSVLLRVPLAFTISLSALLLSSAVILLSMLLCLFYRIVWYGTARGRLDRGYHRFEKRKEKIRIREQMRRSGMSRRADRQKLGELISIVRDKLDQRKSELMIPISVLTRMQLRDCERKMDFDTALEIYQTLAEAQAWTINQRLGRQLGLKQKIYD